jgi:hypothetical protein
MMLWWLRLASVFASFTRRVATSAETDSALTHFTATRRSSFTCFIRKTAPIAPFPRNLIGVYCARNSALNGSFVMSPEGVLSFSFSVLPLLGSSSRRAAMPKLPALTLPALIAPRLPAALMSPAALTIAGPAARLSAVLSMVAGLEASIVLVPSTSPAESMV